MRGPASRYCVGASRVACETQQSPSHIACSGHTQRRAPGEHCFERADSLCQSRHRAPTRRGESLMKARRRACESSACSRANSTLDILPQLTTGRVACRGDVEAVDRRSAKRQSGRSFAFLRACGPAPRPTQARRANARVSFVIYSITAGVQHISSGRHAAAACGRRPASNPAFQIFR